MKVLLLSRYSRAGNTSRVRSYQYLPYLDRAGIEVTSAPLSDDDFVADLYAGRRRNWTAIARSYLGRVRTLLGSRSFDLLWIERELFPYAPALAELVVSRVRVPYVVDYDDAIFHNYDQHRSLLLRALLGRKIESVMRHAALVIVGNDYLARYAQHSGARRVEQLPTAVDVDRLFPRVEKENEVFTIGWIGTPLNARYLLPIGAALREVSRGGLARVVLVGSGNLELDDVPVTIRPWIERDEASDISSFDVGIMPLADEPWERGKCGYKLLQYFACAVPGVASPVGVNRDIVESGVNGFTPSDSREWIQALTTLRDDPQLCKSMGIEGRKKVEKYYSIQVTAPQLVALLEQAADR